MKKQHHLVKQVSNILHGFLVILLFLFGSITNPVLAQNWNEIIKTVASDRGAADRFGWSVDISGDYAIVGAPFEDEDTTGGNTLTSAGSAYILKNNAGTWSEVQKLVASDRGAIDQFGYSVAITGDIAIVGAIGASNDTSGGNPLVRAGSTYIFENVAGTWSEVQKLMASDREASDRFGSSVAISGDFAIIGAVFEDHDTTGANFLGSAGSAYIFKNDSGSWSEVQKLVASDRGAGHNFGNSVSISGDVAVVGAPREDEDTTGGNTLTDAGAAYIFKNNAGTWSEVQKSVASDRAAGDWFASSVAISGDIVIVGAYFEDHDTTGGNMHNAAGSAYIFKNNAGTWSEVQKIVASDRNERDYFGNSVAISGDVAIVGARWEDNDTIGGNFLSDAGSAYIFKNNAGVWSEIQKLVASDREADDNFGISVAISGDVLVVGAMLEDNDTAGGNYLSRAGSAYIFNNCATSGIDVKTACNSFTWIDSVTYTSSNDTTRYILTNAAGCDSVITLNLTINNTKSSDTVSVCDNYTWNVNNTTYTTTGIYKDTLTNAAGCDSIITLNLTISSNSSNDTVNVCDSYTWSANNFTYTTSGIYVDTLSNEAGCDSVVTLNLTINLSTTNNDTVTACDRYTWSANSTIYTNSGIYVDTLSNASGCDSIVTLDLTINYSTTNNDTVTACDRYTWNANNIIYTTSGTYLDTLSNAAGCDSIVTLDLTVNYSTTNNDTVTACDRYTWNANNITYTTSGTYMDTLTTTAGCDSVVTLELTIDSVSDLSTTTAGLTITANNANATYQWLDCGNNYAIIAGDTAQTFTATANGNYAVELTENACVDTSACVAIISVGLLEESVGNELFKIYPNPSNGIMNVEIPLPSAGRNLESNPSLFIYNQMAQVVREVRVEEGKNQINISDLPKGVYFIRYENSSKKIVLME